MLQADIEVDDKAMSKIGCVQCFVVIGEKHIECGVMVNKTWLPQCFFKVHIDFGGEGVLQALAISLQELESLLSQGIEEYWRGKKSPSLQIRILLADCWLSSASLPWTASLLRARTAKAFAYEQLSLIGFEITEMDVIQLDDAPYGEPRLVVSYPYVLLDAVGKFTKRLNGHLASVLPLSVAAWHWVKSVDSKVAALAILDENSFSLGHGFNRLNEIVVRKNIFSNRTDTDSSKLIKTLSEQWQRMKLRDSRLGRVEEVSILNLTQFDCFFNEVAQKFSRIELPESDSNIAVTPYLRLAACTEFDHLSLDAVSASVKMTSLKWGVAVVFLMMNVFFLTQAWDRSASIRLLKDERIAKENARKPEVVRRDLSKDDIVKIQAFNVAIRELNLPISALLRALQPPRDIQVAVLSIDTAGAGASEERASNVKIIAEARTGIDMMRYVSFMAERKPFEGAYLTHHEIVEAQSDRPYRFSVEAKWSE